MHAKNQVDTCSHIQLIEEHTDRQTNRQTYTKQNYILDIYIYIYIYLFIYLRGSIYFYYKIDSVITDWYQYEIEGGYTFFL